MNPSDQEIVNNISALLEDTSRQVQEFAQRTGLSCKAGCGRCCTNPEVETTVTEMLPLAANLWATQKAEQALSALDQAQNKGTCVFYKPDPRIAGNGHCSIYAHRPGICRLFGHAVKMDKYGKPQMVTCTIIKEQHAPQYAAVQQGLLSGGQAPSLPEFARKVFDVDPVRGQAFFPINQAAQLALERIGFAC